MLQELFRIPGLDWPVYGYGLMLVLGVFAAIELGRYLADRVGLNGDDFWTLGIIALVAGVFGARLSHVLENLGQYTDSSRSAWANLKDAGNLSSGGLTFYGGFLVAFPVLVLYGRWRGMPIRLGMDIVAPCVMVGLALGRIGCLLNGCCWGQTCDPNAVPWAITFPYDSPPYVEQFDRGSGPLADKVSPLLTERVPTRDGTEVTVLTDKADFAKDPALSAVARNSRSLPVHPSQIYESLTAALIAAICLAFFTLRRSAGQGFALMVILYSVGRFLLETVRVEPAVKLFGLDPNFSYSMWVAAFTLVGGIALWVAFAVYYKPVPATGAPIASPA